MQGVERALNLFWIAFGVAVCAAALDVAVWKDGKPSKGFMAFGAGLAIAAIGLALTATQGRRPEAGGPFWSSGAGALRVAAVAAGFVVIALLMPVLGFRTAAALVMIGLLQLVERQNWLVAVALAAGAVMGVHWLFTGPLGSTLPRGPFGF